MDLKFEHEFKIPKKKKIIREIIIWTVEIVLVIAIAYIFVNHGMLKIKMVGDSMEATLYDGDKVIINRISYQFTQPKRFDIIAYTQNGEEHSFQTIKRIIGLPGETIQTKEGKIYINDVELEENINIEPILSGGLAQEPITLDENEYFLLGDNRNNSEDSRFANVGNIVKDNIIGKVWIRTNPFSFVHSLNLIEKDLEESLGPT